MTGSDYLVDDVVDGVDVFQAQVGTYGESLVTVALGDVGHYPVFRAEFTPDQALALAGLIREVAESLMD